VRKLLNFDRFCSQNVQCLQTASDSGACVPWTPTWSPLGADPRSYSPKTNSGSATGYILTSNLVEVWNAHDIYAVKILTQKVQV